MKERIITGIILGLLVLWAIFKLGGAVFDTIVVIVLLLAAWEWSDLSHVRKLSVRAIYVLVIAVLIYLSSFVPLLTLWLSLVFWLFVCCLLYFYQKDVKYHPVLCLVMGAFTIVPFFVAIGALHIERPILLLLVMLVVTVADSGAYFVGKKCGKTKLAPVISPNKTIEGLLGGVVFGGVAGAICSIFISTTLWQHIAVIVLSFLIVFIAVIGDLFESMLKRQRGIKDSGNILPGHGGILDRTDSMLASLPIFTLVCVLIGVITF
ncbi:phosphatidate cytidylyltransferase [Fangia hongkongensis]|uniref:phosphatidate cytidylyltransferase n=1 Tax=Fangia hongkongensis TaxID=270495 RepID=UPI0003746DE9|nr:phosphatidate cytidylyltransferase [Fangia hongkongensis]MBK2126124.1 phosphatidate cytidylyltransferase [Fangia hongkongensis]